MTIESLPTFTQPARQRWESIPADIRKRLLSNVWCGHCRHETTITNFSGTIKGGDLLLVGHLGKDTPTVWFPSMATMAAVLSEDNQALLRLICDQRPKSLTELAELTGRQVPNLSRTLRMIEGYGLVELKKNVREIEPIALATSFKILIG